MRVELFGVSPVQNSYNFPISTTIYTPNTNSIMSKDEMERLMNLVIYDQFAMAEKLARIASQMYAGMNFDTFA